MQNIEDGLKSKYKSTGTPLQKKKKKKKTVNIAQKSERDLIQFGKLVTET